MGHELLGRWKKETVKKRVCVSWNNNQIRISIKSNAFALGNNSLNLFLVIALLSAVTLVILTTNTTINFVAAISGILCLGCITVIFFVKFWMWHYFGEEQINIQDNSIAVNRSYGLFSGKPKTLTLNDSSELYVNRADSWSWLKLRSKGLLRIGSDQHMLDFGVKLDDLEYEMIIKHVADHLKKNKLSRQEAKEQVAEKTNGQPLMAETNGKKVIGHNGSLEGKTNEYLIKSTSRNGKTVDLEKRDSNRTNPSTRS